MRLCVLAPAPAPPIATAPSDSATEPASTSERIVGFASALSVIESGALQRHGVTAVGIAGYPEGHPECRDLDRDIGYLRDKVAAGVDFVITQLFYDNADFFPFVARARRAGITVPIIPGLKVLPLPAMAIWATSSVARTTATRCARGAIA